MIKAFRASLYLAIIISILLLSSSCNLFNNKENKTDGCTDPEAYNYNIDAEVDDDTCIYNCPKRSDSVYLTNDSGLTWRKTCLFNNDQNSPTIVDISITDENNIWVCTDYEAKIIHSFDGGYTWDVQYHDNSKTNFFNYIEMFDELNGVAMGDSFNSPPALILKTDDGGESWNEVTTSSPIALGSGNIWKPIDFVSSNVGYFWKGSADNTRGIWKTIDGGQNWSLTNFPGKVWAVKFYNENIGLVVDKEIIYKTVDGGDSWTEVIVPIDTGYGYCHDIEFSESDPSKIWFIRGREVYYSNDGGLTWIMQNKFPADGQNCEDMIILGNEGWIVTNNPRNNGYHSSDATNGNWEEFILPETDNFYQSFAIDGADGQIVAIPGSVI
jgi:photosystem II stability/assembly factor-like uncharacterized protein